VINFPDDLPEFSEKNRTGRGRRNFIVIFINLLVLVISFEISDLKRRWEKPGLGEFSRHSPLVFDICSSLHLELLQRSSNRYWIYAVECNGEPVLRYSDTMRYLRKQLDILNVHPSEYGNFREIMAKLL
jgi:hypothetical protein